MSEIKITCDNCNGSGESTRGYDQCGECNGKGYHLQEMPVANKMSEFKAKTEHINYALLVDPEKEYPVSYYILPNGAKQLCPTVAKGKDLTENQIKELIEKKIVHVGYVPISIYTATRAELATVKAELGRGTWVSVSEPPKSNGKYLVWDVNGLFDDKNELATYVVYNDHWYNESNDMSIHPTHWQPLPTPPHKN